MGTEARVKKIVDFSTGWKVVFIILLYVLISVMLAAMIYFQGRIFDGVRSYVRGEGLWAKAQKDAVLYLQRYSYTHAESDYLAFLNAVEVNLGDKKARTALYALPPNRSEAEKGILQGRNDPRDVDALIWFFLNFQTVSYMRDAIGVWTSADAKIDELIAVGKAIRAEINTQEARPRQMVLLRSKLQKLNDELYELENRFSIVLSEGGRWVRETTWRVSVVMLVLFIGIAVFVSRQIIRGITRSEQELLISESRFRSLKESNTIGIVSWRVDGLIDEANTSFLDMLGFTQEELDSGEVNWRALTPPEMEERDRKAMEELLANGRCEPFEKVFLHKKGYAVPVYIGVSMLSGDHGRGIAFVMDLSERKKAEAELKLASTVFEASYDGILITDAAMHIVSVNRAICMMTGYNEDELKGEMPKVLQSGHTDEADYRGMYEVLEEKGHWEGDIVDRKKNGALLSMRASISSVQNSEGKVTYYVAILSDNAERKALEEQLRHAAHHDMLTGLPNRVLFNDRIDQAVKHAERNQTGLAVLFLDLDNFKPINDRFGHKVGDELLQVVAGRLSSSMRTMDTVTRLGGDEFVILLEEITERETADRILQKIVETVAKPCRIDGHDIEIGISIGISIYPEDGTDAKSLLHHADIAMYRMKERGRKQR